MTIYNIPLWVLIILLVLYVVYKTYNQITLIRYIRKIPGPPTFPILGNLLEITVPPEKVFQIFRNYSAKYGSLYVLWALQWACLNLTNPDDIEIFLSSTKHMDKSKIYQVFAPWLNEGLLTSTGRKWHSRRKILTPAFHFNVLQQFVNTFVEQGEELVKVLKKECGKPHVDINSYMCTTTLQTICETAMGIQLSKDKDVDEYRRLIYKIGEISVYRLCRPWLGTILCWFHKIHYEHLSIAKRLHTFTTKFINERENTFRPLNETIETENLVIKKRKSMAMLDLLLQAKHEEGSIDDGGIREEVDTFTFEGHDTTAMNLAFTLLLLANNKHAQEKVIQELNDVLGDKNEKPTYNDLQNLRYLENCIKESLRLYPSVPFISRTSTENVVASGYFIPKDSIVNIHIYDLHHDEKYFPDPEKFDPDRFLLENSVGRHPYSYLPFSAGPRNCIGQKFALLEVKTILLYILREYELEPVDTPESIVLISDLVLRTKDGIKVRLLPRNKIIK